MGELVWFELFPPRDVSVAAAVKLLRPLATRPKTGLLQRTPVVVFEAWLTSNLVRWAVAVDEPIAASLPGQLRAQLPELELTPAAAARRPEPQLAADLRLSSFAFPLRLDTAEAVSAGVLAVAGILGPHESAVLQWVVGPSYQRAERPQAFNLEEALGFKTRTAQSAHEQQAWRQKAGEPLYGGRCRVGATAATPERMSVIIRSVVGALSLANSSHCAIRSTLYTAARARDLVELRRPALNWSSVVSSSELAGLLGWPLSGVTVPGQSSRLAPVPKQLLRPRVALGTDRVLGASLHPADDGQLVTMPLATSLHNTIVTGPTGSGKSNELATLILADAAAGHGVLVLEPRGDLIEDVLCRLPAHRHADVVVIDPADDDQVGFNPLAGPAQQAEQRADELVGLFRALYGTAIGPRSADVLMHSALTASRLPGGTLADIPILLASEPFRRRAVAQVGDPLVLGQWWNWFDHLSPGEQQQVTAPVGNKLRAFLARQPIRRMLAQPNPKFSFDELFSGRPRVVLVNLNRGVIGPEAARLLGAMLLSASWAAAQRRARLPKAQRYPVALHVDEFQDYVGALDFGEVLAQCRGLGVSITAAHQHLRQLSPHLLAAVTANARSRLSFRPSPDDAAALARVFGAPVTEADLLGLGAFQACARLLVDSAMTPPFAVQTLPLPAARTDAGRLRQASRERYAASGAEVDAALVRRWRGDDDGQPEVPFSVQRRTP
ncbi:type IV secretory system conjugative DNA transfer family protein [Amycolatopsis sp. cmx-4-68]|uniref:type IV secretory system conjugative DNA transfer family protein n=1 Tax=Amycolatopsis sp. cmx-4-68 TaxID=2790938 RepID=UPI00397A2180